MRSAPRGRHAAPSRSALPRALRRAGSRHARPAASRRQPVALVLLGVTGTSLGLVGLLPGAGAAHPPPRATLAAAGAAVEDVDVVRPGDRADRRRAPAVATPPAPTPRPTPADPLPGCDATAAQAGGYANGRIPSSALCALPGHPGHALRADAARAFALLDAARLAETGARLCVTDSYRSYAAQRSLARAKPGLAARPGTSEHGEGLALDLACGAEDFGTETHRWLVSRAERYGWYQPAWARRGGSRPEPWHWEFRG